MQVTMWKWNMLMLLIQFNVFTYVECRAERTVSVWEDFEDSYGRGDLYEASDLYERSDNLAEKHPCRRECRDGAPSRICHYIFKVESYRTMSKACYDCPLNVTDCFRPHCVPADGVKRSILIVNRQMPGPAIEVCQGDRVIVDVTNMLHSESTTMHWHGQHHRQTPYMDGVPYVSQCPIPPGASFRYDYIATEAGTHFWHSHSGFQRGDGVFGALIVRTAPSKDWHRDLYEVDEHVVIVLDWTHRLGIDKFLAHHHSDGDNKAPNLLVNGLGRFKSSDAGNDVSSSTVGRMPIASFLVKPNSRHRFRLINAEFLNCPIEISVDNHTMYVVSSDGRDVEPVEAESLVSYAGERFDFIVEMNQPIGNYWIRFRGLMDCDERFHGAHQEAVLRYEGAPANEYPPGYVTYERPVPISIDDQRTFMSSRVNALNEGTEANSSVSVPMLRAMDRNDESIEREPNYRFYLSYDFYQKDNPHFHRTDYYGFHQVPEINQRLLTPQLNHISMKLPPFPLLSQRDSIDSRTLCNSSTVRDCEKNYCACTHVIQVELNSVVEVILIDEGLAYDANHPFHLHGYQFRVVAMERISDNVTVNDVKRRDAEGRIKRNLDRAPLKDTVTVPDGGYTIIRFFANNPGYWLFHCHIEFHAEIGMALVFKVGGDEEMAPVPKDFPRCGNWMPSRTDPVSPTGGGRQNDSEETEDNEIDRTDGNGSKLYVIRLLPILLREFHILSSASAKCTLPSNSLLIFLSFVITVARTIGYHFRL